MKHEDISPKNKGIPNFHHKYYILSNSCLIIPRILRLLLTLLLKSEA